MDYRIRMELLSDSLFGSGHSIPGSVDEEILYDEIGLPFMKGKTFKGNLRECAEKISSSLSNEFDEELASLFGMENQGVTSWDRLKFSDCTIDNDVRDILLDKVRKGQISPSEIKEALTVTRTFTAIDWETGSYEEASLRTINFVKKGLVYYVDLSLGRELSSREKGLLAGSVLMLRNIGGMRTRGKGEVSCRLLKDGEDISDKYLEKIREVC